MRIKKITSQHRRDFKAIYVCEYCKNEEEGRGYDDTNFHENVIPAMKCSKCGKNNHPDYLPAATKYPSTTII